jgi:hypothetical protein
MLDILNPVNIPEIVAFTKLVNKVNNPPLLASWKSRPTLGLTYKNPYFILSPDEGKRTSF